MAADEFGVTEPLRILNLGAGVQSTTVLLLSCVGHLPRLDCAIFADTGWEKKRVYEHLAWLEIESAKYGIPVHRVGGGDIRADALRSQVKGYDKAKGERWASMPLFTLQTNGRIGRIKRQCTNEYKIAVITQFVRRELLGLEPRQHAPEGAVEQWFGISVDECHRSKPFRNEKWHVRVDPLIDLLFMRRRDCLRWLSLAGFPEPPRSACIGCPFHSNVEWRAIQEDPDDWRDAVEFDEAIRHCGGMRGEMFLHRSCRPLKDVDLRTDVEKGQQLFAWADECDGVCGV